MKTIIVDSRFVLFINPSDFIILKKILSELKVAEKSVSHTQEDYHFNKYHRFIEVLKKKYKPIKIDLKA